MMQAAFPFTAVVGHTTVKLALILLAINPRIGGLLVSGPRGSAKSTLARSLAGLNSADEPTALGSMVTLPLGASEEMLTGTLDLQQALSDQQVAFAPGLLSKAHKGLLYVDEVNLLPDSLVDLLLDVAESGINYVERDGISHQHEANFVLMGTMNPDEGELRPQLLDRFGFMVTLDDQLTPQQRVDIVRRRQAFDEDPDAFLATFADQQTQLIQQIANAQALLSQVNIEEALRLEIAQRCSKAQVDGLRADLVWLKAACTHAAWGGQTDVRLQDIDAVEALVLAHRRQAPPEANDDQGANGRDGNNQNSAANNAHETTQPNKPPSSFSRPEGARKNMPDTQHSTRQQTGAGVWGQMPPQIQTTQTSANSRIAKAFTAAHHAVKTTALSSLLRPAKQASRGRQGHGQGDLTQQKSTRVHWFQSLLAGRGGKLKLRFRRQKGADPCLHVLLLDTSASTLQHQGQGQAKGLVATIVQQAYLKRQQLLLLGFGNDRVEVLLAHGRAPKVIRPMLDTLGAGGGTPLQQALQQAGGIAKQWLQRQPASQIMHYLISDGRVPNLPITEPLRGQSVFIDIEQSTIKRGRGRQIAQQLGAKYVTLAQLQGHGVPLAFNHA